MDVVATATQPFGDVTAPPRLECEGARLRLPWVERGGEVVGVEAGRVDRHLKVVPEDDVAEKDVQRPLILLIPTRSAEREVRSAVAKRE